LQLCSYAVEYLQEYESVFKTALAHESVDPGVLFDEKTRGRKSHANVPLKALQNHLKQKVPLISSITVQLEIKKNSVVQLISSVAVQ
jgi:hypothetical protein